MPTCPECDHDTESIEAFVYIKHADDEGHDVPPRLSERSQAFLVCPDCESVLGGLGDPNPF